MHPAAHPRKPSPADLFCKCFVSDMVFKLMHTGYIPQHGHVATRMTSCMWTSLHSRQYGLHDGHHPVASAG